MLLAVLKREVQEALELVEIIGDKCRVVCLANSSYRYAKDGGAKATVLCSGKLLIVIDLVVLVTEESSMFSWTVLTRKRMCLMAGAPPLR